MANNIPVDKITGQVNELNKSLQATTTILGKLIKEQQTLSKDIAGAKGLKDVNDKLNKTKTTQNEIEKQGNKLLTTRNTLVVKQDEKLRALTKDVIKQREAQSQLTKELKAEDDAYKKLNLQYQKAAANAKKLAAQYGVSSKQAKSAAKQAKVLNTRLKDIDKSVGQNQRKVGSYFQSLVKFAGAMGLATGGVALFKKGLDVAKDSILSIQSTGDKFTNTLAGLKEGYNAFLRSAASGSSFKDLIQNFRDAVKVGAEYSAILDDLGDLQRSLRIAESETRLEQEKLLTVSRNVTKSDQERITAIDKYINLENELVKDRKKNAEQAYAAELLIASQRSELSQSEIEDFLKNQEAYIDMVQKRSIAASELEKQQKSIDLTTEEGRKKQIDSLNDLLTEQSEEEKAIGRIIENAEQLDDTLRDRLVNAYKAVIDVETNSLKSSQRVLTMRNSLIKSLGTNTNAEIEGLNKIKTKTIENVGVLEDLNQEILTNDKALIERQKKAQEDYDLWLKNKNAERNKEIRDQFISSATDLGNILFDLGQSQRDRELEGIRSNYAAQITAAEGNSELQAKLTKDLAREEAKIQREQAKSERNQALFNIAISTAQAIASVNPVVPLMVLAGSLGLAQTAAVLSQPLPEIPGFFKGTESAPAGLKWVAEKGSELINMPDGNSFLATEKQLINTDGGEQILNHADTTKALNSAIYNDIAVNGNEGIEARLDKLIASNKNLKQVNVNFDKGGMDIYLQKNSSIIRNINGLGKI